MAYFKFAVIGYQGVGKSNYIELFGNQFYFITNKGKVIIKLIEDFYPEVQVDGIILMCDVTNLESWYFINAERCIGDCVNITKNIVLLGNKIDIVKERKVRYKNQINKRTNQFPYFDTSCETGFRYKDPIKELLKYYDIEVCEPKLKMPEIEDFLPKS